jgi:large subunit ribosomal protein L14
MNRRCVLYVVDNSGAKTARIIGVLGNPMCRTIKVGDVVSVAIREHDPASTKVDRKSKSKSKFSALVVASRYANPNHVGYTRLNYNAVILLGDDIRKKRLVPIGTRIVSPIDEQVFDKIKYANAPLNIDAISKVLLTAGSLVKCRLEKEVKDVE